jgi:hypothetical protein
MFELCIACIEFSDSWCHIPSVFFIASLALKPAERDRNPGGLFAAQTRQPAGKISARDRLLV